MIDSYNPILDNVVDISRQCLAMLCDLIANNHSSSLPHHVSWNQDISVYVHNNLKMHFCQNSDMNLTETIFMANKQ